MNAKTKKSNELKNKFNQVLLQTDGICVYYSAKVRPANIARVVTFIIGALLLTPFVVLIVRPENAIYDILSLFSFTAGAVLTIALGRYILWNIYGEEFISFSTKSIRFRYHYGLLQTKEQTLPHSGKLGFTFDKVRKIGKDHVGTVMFYEYDVKDQAHALIETAVYMKEREYRELVEKIQLVFAIQNPHPNRNTICLN